LSFTEIVIKKVMPTESTEERKLAAIMFTDMVGYSALATRDDKSRSQLLGTCRRLLRESSTVSPAPKSKPSGTLPVEFGSGGSGAMRDRNPADPGQTKSRRHVRSAHRT